MKSLTEHNTSYSFYEKVADDMLKNMDVFEPEADLEEDGLWYFVIDRIKTPDDDIIPSFEVTLKELEEARKSHQPLVNLMKQIVQQLIPDYFKWFEYKFGYWNLEDIIQILSRFFIPKLYNKYLKEENAPDAPIVLREHKSINKLVDKVYNEIGDSLILTDETIELHFPYFKDTKGQPEIYYDPFHSNVGKFDTNYVLSELKRFVAFHLLQTMGIGEKLQYRDYDPMVDPIAQKLLKDIYKKAVVNGFVQYDSLDTLGLNETKIRKTEDREYHRNGFINRVIKDILKRVELTLNEIVFDVVRDYGLTIDKPKIIYQYGEEGLSRDSVTVIRDAVPSMVHWYLSKHDLSSGSEDPTVDIIASILSDIIIEKIIEFQEDEDWDDYKETWVLGESKKITFIDKVTQRVIGTIDEDENHYYFKEILSPHYETDYKEDYGNKFAPLSVKKNGLNNELRNSSWLYNKLKDFYGEMYGLGDEEMLELYNNILYHILKNRNLNSLNPVLIGDWDLEYTPSLQINKEDWESYIDKDYNLRNLEDYIAMINFMGYDKVGDDVELYRNENNISYQDKYTEGWTKEDFKPFHQDLVNSLENYHGQKL